MMYITNSFLDMTDILKIGPNNECYESLCILMQVRWLGMPFNCLICLKSLFGPN